MSINAKRVSKNLRKMIVDSGMSAEKVAQGAGISKSQISYYLKSMRTPSIKTLEKISDFLKRDFQDFFRS